MHPQETEKALVGGEEALPAPPQRDHDVVMEAAPSHTGEEEAHGQQYNIISQEEDDNDEVSPQDLPPDDELPPTRYNLRSQATNIMASVIAEEHMPAHIARGKPRRLTYGLYAANDALQSFATIPQECFAGAIVDEETGNCLSTATS